MKKHYFCKDKGVMAPTTSGASAKHKPRGRVHPGMAANTNNMTYNLGRELSLMHNSQGNSIRRGMEGAWRKGLATLV